jgi:hypothetical protein
LAGSTGSMNRWMLGWHPMTGGCCKPNKRLDTACPVLMTRIGRRVNACCKQKRRWSTSGCAVCLTCCPSTDSGCRNGSSTGSMVSWQQEQVCWLTDLQDIPLPSLQNAQYGSLLAGCAMRCYSAVAQRTALTRLTKAQ